ncbi:MAG: DUF2155 domain-containing protein [Erythrobacter sp.]
MRALVLLLPLSLALTACDWFAPKQGEVVKVPLDEPSPVAAPAPASSVAPGNDYGATPMNERVAVLGLLNKRNNVSEELKLKPGEAREIGPVIVRVAACERTAPWEMPQQTGAFVQVDIRERGAQQHRRVFSGWMFLESPSLNVVEHPIYDVWVKDCIMRFPGEEGPASPKAEASPKPAARPSAAPEAAPSPGATPAA